MSPWCLVPWAAGENLSQLQCMWSDATIATVPLGFALSLPYLDKIMFLRYLASSSVLLQDGSCMYVRGVGTGVPWLCAEKLLGV